MTPAEIEEQIRAAITTIYGAAANPRLFSQPAAAPASMQEDGAAAAAATDSPVVLDSQEDSQVEAGFGTVMIDGVLCCARGRQPMHGNPLMHADCCFRVEDDTSSETTADSGDQE